MKFAGILIAAALLSGCASYQLPPVTAAKIVYDRADPIGGTHIEAVNVRVENDTVKAARATWVTQYPSWKISVTIEDYERRITP